MLKNSIEIFIRKVYNNNVLLEKETELLKKNIYLRADIETIRSWKSLLDKFSLEWTTSLSKF